MIKFNFIFRNFRFLLVTLLLLFCFVVSLGLLYLNRFDVNITNIHLSKENPVVFYDSREHKSVHIGVKEFDRISIDQVPLLIQEVLIKREGLMRSCLEITGILRYLVMDIRDVHDFYDPDITTKLAHNSLIIYKKAWPLLTEEHFLAEKVRKKYSKAKILESYLNQIYFGYGIYGVGAASRYYFGKNISDLEVHQIALLMCFGIDFYSGSMDELKPLQEHSPKLLNKYRNSMLDYMLRRDLITSETAEEFKRKPLDLVISLKEN